MVTITLQVSKSYVWEEAAKTASYTGDKMKDDAGAYDRIQMTDSDTTAWQRFWEEAASAANDYLKEMLSSSSSISGDYSVSLEVSASYDTSLTDSVQTDLKSFFINAIVGKWYKFTNKSEAESYLKDAELMMQNALRKLYSRKRPIRPTRN